MVGEAASADSLYSVERSSPKVAPTCSWLAYVRSDSDGASLWLRSVDGLSDRELTSGGRRGLEEFFWSADGRWLLYLQDDGGDENWRLFAADVASGAVRDLTPFDGVQVQVVRTSPLRPESVLLAMNLEDRTRHDAYRLDLGSGALTLVARNEGFARWLADGELSSELDRVTAERDQLLGNVRRITDAPKYAPPAAPRFGPRGGAERKIAVDQPTAQVPCGGSCSSRPPGGVPPRKYSRPRRGRLESMTGGCLYSPAPAGGSTSAASCASRCRVAAVSGWSAPRTRSRISRARS